MTWIVDSSVWINAFNGVGTREVLLLREAIGSAPIALGDLILLEVMQGFRNQSEFDSAYAHLLRFPVFVMGGVAIAKRSAENYRFLRRRGITVRSTIDCVIATYCIDNDLDLLCTDRDFLPFVQLLGLRVVA